MARRKSVGGVNLAAVEHDIKGLCGREPSQGNAGRPEVHAKRAAVAQVLGAADEPRNIKWMDAVKLAQKNPEPERSGHDVIRHADALAAQIGQTSNFSGSARIQPEPHERFGWKNRQRRPLPTIARRVFASDEILGKRHLENVE